MRLFRSASARHELSPDRLIRIFQSETAEIQEAGVPVRLRLTLLLLALLFASLILVASCFKIDRVVTSFFGQIVTVEPTEVLQPLDTSIIKSIKVQEGDRVRAGQLLATLDPTLVAADVKSFLLQIDSLDAQIARCEAELAQRPFAFEPRKDGDGAHYSALQRSYYDQRKAQFDAQIRAYEAQIAQARATMTRLRVDQTRYGDREGLAKQIEDMRASLAASQFGSRLNLLLASDQKIEMLRNLEFDQNSLSETEQQLASTVATRDAFIQQWRAESTKELVDARNQRDTAQEQLTKATKHRDLVRLEAPNDAIVLKLARLSVGSVLQPGEPFIELAPLQSQVEAEVYINPRDVGFIRPGDAATIKLDPYHFVEHGLAQGKLRWISQGTFTTTQTAIAGAIDPAGTSPGAQVHSASQNSAAPFYKARIGITKISLRNVPTDFRLLPGTTLEADIHVGTRSLFWYLTDGVVRGFDEAMREP